MRKRKIEVGDSILIHGWTDPKKPYRSPWDKQMRVTVTEVIFCFASDGGIKFEKSNTISWDDIIIDIIAMNDFIDPPTGLALRDVLFELNGAPGTPEKYQVIRWRIDWDATIELRNSQNRIKLLEGWKQ